jgi:aromatic ring-cleaving dioxygenase
LEDVVTEPSGYHAHVYFSPTTREAAVALRENIISRFAVEPGGFSDEPVGPHPISQFNVKFAVDEFQNIVPWLMFNRGELDVLVHPLTDDMVLDHSTRALWLGTPVAEKLDTLRGRPYRPELLLKGAAAE